MNCINYDASQAHNGFLWGRIRSGRRFRLQQKSARRSWIHTEWRRVHRRQHCPVAQERYVVKWLALLRLAPKMFADLDSDELPLPI